MFTQPQVWKAIEALARRHGWSLSQLAVRAGLDPTALNRSKRRNPNGDPRWPSTHTLSLLLQATQTSLATFEQLMEEAEGEGKASASGDILFVEDDAQCREVLVERLRRDGHRVLAAGDGRLALDFIESDRPITLLCTDVVMSDGVWGPAIARRALLQRPRLKVLFMTAYQFPEAALLKLGEILHKPFGPDLLRDRVATMLADRSGRESLSAQQERGPSA